MRERGAFLGKREGISPIIDKRGRPKESSIYLFHPRGFTATIPAPFLSGEQAVKLSRVGILIVSAVLMAFGYAQTPGADEADRKKGDEGAQAEITAFRIMADGSAKVSYRIVNKGDTDVFVEDWFRGMGWQYNSSNGSRVLLFGGNLLKTGNGLYYFLRSPKGLRPGRFDQAWSETFWDGEFIIDREKVKKARQDVLRADSVATLTLSFEVKLLQFDVRTGATVEKRVDLTAKRRLRQEDFASPATPNAGKKQGN